MPQKIKIKQAYISYPYKTYVYDMENQNEIGYYVDNSLLYNYQYFSTKESGAQINIDVPIIKLVTKYKFSSCNINNVTAYVLNETYVDSIINKNLIYTIFQLYKNDKLIATSLKTYLIDTTITLKSEETGAILATMSKSLLNSIIIDEWKCENKQPEKVDTWLIGFIASLITFRRMHTK